MASDAAVKAAARTTIAVQGARVHNLKNISLEIPRDSLIVVTTSRVRASRVSRSTRSMPRDSAARLPIVFCSIEITGEVAAGGEREARRSRRQTGGLRRTGKSIHEIGQLNFDEPHAFLGGIQPTGRGAAAGRQVLNEVRGRLELLHTRDVF